MCCPATERISSRLTYITDLYEACHTSMHISWISMRPVTHCAHSHMLRPSQRSVTLCVHISWTSMRPVTLCTQWHKLWTSTRPCHTLHTMVYITDLDEALSHSINLIEVLSLSVCLFVHPYSTDLYKIHTHIQCTCPILSREPISLSFFVTLSLLGLPFMER